MDIFWNNTFAGQNFMLAHIPVYGYIWIRQYGKMLYMWASMKFLPICKGIEVHLSHLKGKLLSC